MNCEEPIRPRWVLVNGILHNVSEFADLQPGQRPTALCPICQTNVLLKLGNIRVHHYAHLPEVDCKATQPETALHLNAKYYLYFQLQQTRSLVIQITCADGCGASHIQTWLQDWDDVIVEHSLGSFRPDITLFRCKEPIGALEILVSHKVTQQKASYFTTNNFPCLEISVTESFYEGDSRWTPARPLQFFQQYPIPEKWTCENCLEIQRKQKEQFRLRQEQVKRKQEWVQKQIDNNERIVETRLADIYFPSGKKYREMYFLKEQLENGKRSIVWVVTDKGTIVVGKQPFSELSIKNLHLAVKQRLKDFRNNGAVIDHYEDWKPWVAGKKYVARDLTRHPFRYHWDEEEKKWANNEQPKPSIISFRSDFAIFQTENEPDYFYEEKVGTCKVCGTITADWIQYFGNTKECICRNCQKK